VDERRHHDAEDGALAGPDLLNLIVVLMSESATESRLVKRGRLRPS